MAENGAHPPTPWYLYILECAGNRLYTGIAIDVDARFEAHLAGRGAKFTRSYPPERLLLVRQYSSRGEALREEIAVKKLSAPEKWDLIRTATNEPGRIRRPRQ
ncbi:GIY-YIG nuclease family protein [Parvibaculum sp.]|jgi:putative endonuclease|uniref:GIY-YIG nuclease family protein n=1 Tax=Parvibaculum sp. TaxID=2024848 RepID=UPI002FDAA4A8